jgi:hypothetical protein
MKRRLARWKRHGYRRRCGCSFFYDPRIGRTEHRCPGFRYFVRSFADTTTKNTCTAPHIPYR